MQVQYCTKGRQRRPCGRKSLLQSSVEARCRRHSDPFLHPRRLSTRTPPDVRDALCGPCGTNGVRRGPSYRTVHDRSAGRCPLLLIRLVGDPARRSAAQSPRLPRTMSPWRFPGLLNSRMSSNRRERETDDLASMRETGEDDPRCQAGMHSRGQNRSHGVVGDQAGRYKTPASPACIGFTIHPSFTWRRPQARPVRISIPPHSSPSPSFHTPGADQYPFTYDGARYKEHHSTPVIDPFVAPFNK